MSRVTKALLVVNLGTPDSPGIRDVRKYLSEFLNDPRVIDLPLLARKLLVNLVIVPFRSRRSSNLYKRLWTVDGSPMLVYFNLLIDKLRKITQGKYVVYGAMRYGNPSLKEALEKIRQEGYDVVTVFPMYPQYASSTTGSVTSFVMKQIGKWQVIPRLKIIDQYYNHPSYIRAVANRIQSCGPGLFDFVLFSYHGLPERQVNKVHPGLSCQQCTCDSSMPDSGRLCYRAACYETSRLLAARLGLADNTYATSFQSRLSRKWLTPFTDVTLSELAARGCKRVLVAAPSFTADCLETRIEIAEEYSKQFKEQGGQMLVLADGLNEHDDWAEAVVEITS
jgi:ferrochelatase